ncbi:S41 family peptidase [Luteipulveratus sp. YIM 133132]|uniref:S41 family peptidase n=1 Tax=Luteipulveratus flavus TaxID=3031728 RepID=UPI0023B0EBA7|nr:S41 family peptidase [Luteipulveratus sp. YIM 133132]MDE9366635.1 S41 family peptidase [Luteipulveratus sp. YIM 133132]
MASSLLDRLAQLVRDQYVLEHDIDAICASLDGPALPDDPEPVAAELTRRLQAVNHDRHLRVRHRPAGAFDGFGAEGSEQLYAREARANAGGIEQVRLLGDGVGLLAVAPYVSPVHLAAPYVTAAFTLLADVRHLIVDVRGGRGGTPETVALLCSYLLGGEPVHLQDLVSRHEPAHQFWTTPVAGRLAADVTVDVLTSSATFSGCEELAYDLQALGRARVIGETTRGGAHPCDLFSLTDVLEVTVPVAASRNAVTGTNWEQVGVRPDIACPADEALDLVLDGARSAA